VVTRQSLQLRILHEKLVVYVVDFDFIALLWMLVAWMG
jgi:hypothetical protein